MLEIVLTFTIAIAVNYFGRIILAFLLFVSSLQLMEWVHCCLFYSTTKSAIHLTQYFCSAG